MKNNRLTNYLKLVLYFIENSSFIKTHDNSDIADRYLVRYKSDKVSIEITKTLYGKYYSIKYNMSRVRIFDQCDFGNCSSSIELNYFGRKDRTGYCHIHNINIESKDEFFNYIVQCDETINHQYEDIEVLNKILNLIKNQNLKRNQNG